MALLPVQFSAGSHWPPEERQTLEAGLKAQVPILPARLQASQSPPLQLVLQQTLSTQLPLEHSPGAAHEAPLLLVAVHTLFAQ